jgi:hypothetical protein
VARTKITDTFSASDGEGFVVEKQWIQRGSYIYHKNPFVRAIAENRFALSETKPWLRPINYLHAANI